MMNSVIIGSGCFLPEKNIEGSYFKDSEFYTDEGEKIEKDFDEVLEKFIAITEIENRRYINDDMVNSDIATIACKKAIEDAKINPEDLDFILFAHNFGDVSLEGVSDSMPSLSARLKNKLGIKNRKCTPYDVNFGCPGWIEALRLGDILIKSGQAKLIVVVGSETLSRVTDPYDRNKMIFADGAGAVVLKAHESDQAVGILACTTVSDNAEELGYLENNVSLNPNLESTKTYIRMRGRKIYEYALKHVPDAIKQTMDSVNIGIDDVAKILIHQANAKMDHAMVKRLHKLYGRSSYHEDIAPMTIQQLGNSSVATIPTMYNLIKTKTLGHHEIQSNDLLVMASVGAGMNINCIIYKEL